MLRGILGSSPPLSSGDASPPQVALSYYFSPKNESAIQVIPQAHPPYDLLVFAHVFLPLEGDAAVHRKRGRVVVNQGGIFLDNGEERGELMQFM